MSHHAILVRANVYNRLQRSNKLAVIRKIFAEMDRWVGKVALVTGASSGIGAETARALAEKGMKVIAIARRLEMLEKLAECIKRECKAEVYPMQCDVEQEKDILKVFQWAEEKLGGIDVLVNNAGVVSLEPIHEGKTETFHKLLDVNVIAMAICSREFVQSVKKRKVPGHIINISSIAGHNAECIIQPVSVYCASKYAVTGMAASLRNEMSNAKIDVKVTNISPGAVDTEILSRDNLAELTKDMPKMKAKDIAETVIYSLAMPHHVQICEIIITPHEMAFTRTNSNISMKK